MGNPPAPWVAFRDQVRPARAATVLVELECAVAGSAGVKAGGSKARAGAAVLASTSVGGERSAARKGLRRLARLDGSQQFFRLLGQ